MRKIENVVIRLDDERRLQQVERELDIVANVVIRRTSMPWKGKNRKEEALRGLRRFIVAESV